MCVRAGSGDLGGEGEEETRAATRRDIEDVLCATYPPPRTSSKATPLGAPKTARLRSPCRDPFFQTFSEHWGMFDLDLRGRSLQSLASEGDTSGSGYDTTLSSTRSDVDACGGGRRGARREEDVNVEEGDQSCKNAVEYCRLCEQVCRISPLLFVCCSTDDTLNTPLPQTAHTQVRTRMRYLHTLVHPHTCVHTHTHSHPLLTKITPQTNITACRVHTSLSVRLARAKTIARCSPGSIRVPLLPA